MNGTDNSIQDAMVKIKSWILLDYNKVREELSHSSQFYASSLMVQLFIRRVVEMALIEGCYNKVRLLLLCDRRLCRISLRTP